MFTYVYMSFFLDNCHLFAGLPCGFVGEADGLWGMDLHGSGVFPPQKKRREFQTLQEMMVNTLHLKGVKISPGKPIWYV